MTDDNPNVWEHDVEDAFEEALKLYPPCGRRKIVLSEEGKMFGRNELIARYIKTRTGKVRSRKQVSSHIQVLARKKTKDMAVRLKGDDEGNHAIEAMQKLSSAELVSSQIVSTNKEKSLQEIKEAVREAKNNRKRFQGHSRVVTVGDQVVFQESTLLSKKTSRISPTAFSTMIDESGHYEYNGFDDDNDDDEDAAAAAAAANDDDDDDDDDNLDNMEFSSSSPSLVMTEFSAFIEFVVDPVSDTYAKHTFVHLSSPMTDFRYHDDMEVIALAQIHDKFPGLRELFEKGPTNSFFLVKFWADMAVEQLTGFYGITTKYESSQSHIIMNSTKVCSFGQQVVEKLQEESAVYEDGRFTYTFEHSPMCDYMISFIGKLNGLGSHDMMNNVLENFAVLQIVTNRNSKELLFCCAFVFEVSSKGQGTQHHVYRLVGDDI